MYCISDPLVRKRTDRRGEHVTGESYKNDDYYRIRVVLYLFSNRESNRHQMLHNNDYGLSRIERGRLTILLEKMIESKWIKKFESPHATGVIVYDLEQRGREMAEYVHKLKNENDSHPIFDLECSFGIKSLGLPND